jgi:hypothetical protein
MGMSNTGFDLEMLDIKYGYASAFAAGTWPKCYKNIMREGGGQVPAVVGHAMCGRSFEARPWVSVGQKASPMGALKYLRNAASGGWVVE